MALRTAVVGCGLIGRRRAAEAAQNDESELVLVVDTDDTVAQTLAAEYACAADTNPAAALGSSVDAVVVATPNGFLAEVGTAALRAGKHVLIEKPMGRNLSEALALEHAASEAGRILKIGFNHRYHPAMLQARALLDAGTIGDLINVRARYGHGGRPGYERDWRGNPELAGGGELTDQGVHVFDLLHWYAGAPREVYCLTQTAVWPLESLEDNGFALLSSDAGWIASVHTSWTQWKNLFSFEMFGKLGSISLEGLGRSYGTERLVLALRKPEGGVPDMEEFAYEGPDRSWALEWNDFLGATLHGRPYLGTPADGVAVMRTLDAAYRSARSNTPAQFVTVDR